MCLPEDGTLVPLKEQPSIEAVIFLPVIIRPVHIGKTQNLIFLIKMRLDCVLLLLKRGAGLNVMMRFQTDGFYFCLSIETSSKK